VRGGARCSSGAIRRLANAAGELHLRIQDRRGLRPTISPCDFSSCTGRGVPVRVVAEQATEEKKQNADSTARQLLGMKGAALETDKWKIRVQLTKPVTWIPLIWGKIPLVQLPQGLSSRTSCPCKSWFLPFAAQVWRAVLQHQATTCGTTQCRLPSCSHAWSCQGLC
jgi:hypothetical protein